MTLLSPHVTCVVHPIDVAAHPSIPPGFRWAVMVGVGAHDDMSRCANAGWCPTEQEACMEGEMVAVTAVKALRMLGIPAGYELVRLPDDPIPAGCDRVTIGV